MCGYKVLPNISPRIKPTHPTKKWDHCKLSPGPEPAPVIWWTLTWGQVDSKESPRRGEAKYTSQICHLSSPGVKGMTRQREVETVFPTPSPPPTRGTPLWGEERGSLKFSRQLECIETVKSTVTHGPSKGTSSKRWHRGLGRTKEGLGK